MYILENTETWMKIATFESLEEAQIAMNEFEAEDKKDWNYTEWFYSITYKKTNNNIEYWTNYEPKSEAQEQMVLLLQNIEQWKKMLQSAVDNNDMSDVEITIEAMFATTF